MSWKGKLSSRNQIARQRSWWVDVEVKTTQKLKAKLSMFSSSLRCYLLWSSFRHMYKQALAIKAQDIEFQQKESIRTLELSLSGNNPQWSKLKWLHVEDRLLPRLLCSNKYVYVPLHDLSWLLAESWSPFCAWNWARCEVMLSLPRTLSPARAQGAGPLAQFLTDRDAIFLLSLSVSGFSHLRIAPTEWSWDTLQAWDLESK